MPERREALLVRPNITDGRVDVLSDVMRSLRLRIRVGGRVLLKAPWALRIPKRDRFVFYVVARGGMTLQMEDRELPLSAGDVALIPRGDEHLLRDQTGRRILARDMAYHDCAATGAQHEVAFGGDGPVTEMIGGGFEFEERLEHPLLRALAPLVHLRADQSSGGGQWLAATVSLLVAEAACSGDGRSIVMERLAEVLLVQALRVHAHEKGCQESGLRALVDPAVGEALRRIHADPGADWTVASLAHAGGLSRSGFAVRFQELVGETPLKYVTRWRVARAAELLRDGNEGIAAIGERMGYASEAAFNRAFKRLQGVGPGAYRRSALRRATSRPDAERAERP